MTELTTPSSSHQFAPTPAKVGQEQLGVPIAATETVDGEAPAVVAVLITTNPGEHFHETLGSLAAQDYANLSVLVVDAADGEEIADQVAEILPDAYIHRVTGAPGFSAAANQAITLISGAAFLLFCHDDISLDARCTSALVEELYRSNAGVVSPKVVQWNDRRRLQQIGRSSDRFGVQIDLVAPDEFDQEQYDSVRDVFVAPSGVQLVRADLFEALGGFDPVIPSLGEDLDFCWRAHIAGARVLAVPSARARHLDDHEEFGTEDDRRRLISRHRLRTLLVVSSGPSLLVYLPLAVLLLLAEALYCLLTGRRHQAAGAISALSWNASRIDEIRDRRASVKEFRKVPDNEVRRLQIGGSARISGFFRHQFGARQDRLVGLVGSVRRSLKAQDSKADRDGIVLAVALSVIIVFGSRNLLDRGLVNVGQIPFLPSTGTLLKEWTGGWRSAGLGGPGNAPTAFLVFGVLKALFFWAPSLVDWLVIFGPLAFGVVGMWRLVHPFDSVRASSVAATAYVFNPVMPLAFSTGRWDGLVLFATAPALIGSILRVQGMAPFGRRGGPAGPGVVDRDLPVRLLRLGLLVAAVATFVPTIVPIAVLSVLAIGIASLIVARVEGLVRLALGAAVVVVVPVTLHLPWSVDLLSRLSWAWLVGQPSSIARFDSLADLVRFAPDGDPSRLSLGLLVAAGVALIIGRGRRFDIGVTGWVLALAFWFGLWLERRGILPVALPAPELLLVLSAAGLALAVGVGARSVEVDLRTHQFGWRQLGVVAGVIGLAAFSLLGINSSLDGRWGLPTHDFGAFTVQLEDQNVGATRVLWLASPAIAPMTTLESAGGVHFAVTEGARPSVLQQYSPASYGAMSEVGQRLDLAARGETVRLGRLLGMYGIDYVIVMTQLAPPPYEGRSFHSDNEPATGVVAALQSQLDLERLTGGIPALIVYRNGSSAGPVVSLQGLDEIGPDPEDQLRVDLTAGQRVEVQMTSPGRWQGTGLDVDNLWLAVNGSGWDSNDETSNSSITRGGMLMVEPNPGSSLMAVDVSYQDSGYRRLGLLVQFALVVLAYLLAQSRRAIS